jgi:hypothetical protein
MSIKGMKLTKSVLATGITAFTADLGRSTSPSE